MWGLMLNIIMLIIIDKLPCTYNIKYHNKAWNVTHGLNCTKCIIFKKGLKES